MPRHASTANTSAPMGTSASAQHTTTDTREQTGSQHGKRAASCANPSKNQPPSDHGPGATPAEDDGHLLVMVYDVSAPVATMCLEVLDAVDIAKGPVATIALPDVVPPGMHGSWSKRYMGVCEAEDLPYTNDIRVQR